MKTGALQEPNPRSPVYIARPFPLRRTTSVLLYKESSGRELLKHYIDGSGSTISYSEAPSRYSSSSNSSGSFSYSGSGQETKNLLKEMRPEDRESTQKILGMGIELDITGPISWLAGNPIGGLKRIFESLNNTGKSKDNDLSDTASS